MTTSRLLLHLAVAFALATATSEPPVKGQTPATASTATATATATTLQPWCSNSFRVRVAPSSPSPATSAARARLRATLDARGEAELPAALIDACGPGAPVSPAPGGAAAASGNLLASALADGSLRFVRADSGAELFTARATLEPPSYANSCVAGAGAGAGNVFVADNMTLAAAAAWCDANASCAAFTSEAAATATCGAALDDRVGRRILFKNASDVNNDTAWLTFVKPPGSASPLAGFLVASVTIAPGDANERVFGLGQGGWTGPNSCPSGPQRVVPLQRNGQTVSLMQHKFNVGVPLTFSSGGYMFLFNMPGAGSVVVGAYGAGGAVWTAQAALSLDFWVSTVPAGTDAQGAAPALYRQYADATGHAPLLREDAYLFWQSRNRYKSSAIAMSIAERYAQLDLPVGVLVIDYENQVHDGDFAPNPACYPSVAELAAGVRATLNATLFFSFWPEVQASSPNYAPLKALGCLINPDLGGLAFDATVPACRDHVWNSFVKPNYYDQGVSAFWLDETDGAGTNHGYDTSFGPAQAYSNLWVNAWISLFSTPVSLLGDVEPLLLTRGVWAGGQRYGVVLWSSDIWSSFEELASQVPQGVHASMSGIPWWTTDVGGYGCGNVQPNDSDYMRELIVRWYQFGLFSPVFRTHGCRDGPSEPDVAPCVGVHGSCGGNEVWSYNSTATQATLSSYVIFRRDVLRPYIAALARNVTVEGVPTVRPLWYEFASDPACYDVDDQYLLGPSILVAPVVVQGATNRSVVFPAGATWVSMWDASDAVQGGQTLVVQAPLAVIPAYWRA